MQTEKHFMHSILLDIYGVLLTNKQRDALDMSLNEDLSLSEIAENTGVSRQAAQDAIKKAEQRLEELEAALGMYRRQQAIDRQLSKMQQCIAAGGEAEKLLAHIEAIKKILWED